MTKLLQPREERPSAEPASAEPARLLARGVCRALADHGLATLTEFTLGSGRRVDVIGLDRRGQVTIVEIKTCLEDFRSDHKWPEYLGFCDRFYFAVYGARAGFWRSLYDFFAWRFPAGVRAAAGAVLLSFAVFMLGAATAFWLTLGNADWFYTFVPADLAGGRNPGATTEALRETLYTKPEDASEWLYSFAAFLFSHNARIAMLCFALGFALGVPVVLMIFYNGAILGAFIALFHDRGLSQELLGWLLIHGSTELLALWLCAGAGLVLGGAVAFPGRHGRLANLARRGRQASVVVMGAVFMLFIAGLLEGLGRQIVNDTAVRYMIGCGAFVAWMLYFTLAGRGRRDGGD